MGRVWKMSDFESPSDLIKWTVSPTRKTVFTLKKGNCSYRGIIFPYLFSSVVNFIAFTPNICLNFPEGLTYVNRTILQSLDLILRYFISFSIVEKVYDSVLKYFKVGLNPVSQSRVLGQS